MTNQDHGNDATDQPEILTSLTPQAFAELRKLENKLLASLTFWEDSLAYGDEVEVTPEDERIFFDCDLYFADHHLLEVYGASIYDDPDNDPLQGLDTIAQALGDLAEDGSQLFEVAADAEDGLVLIFGSNEASRAGEISLIMAVSGWALGAWQELPDEE